MGGINGCSFSAEELKKERISRFKNAFSLPKFSFMIHQKYTSAAFVESASIVEIALVFGRSTPESVGTQLVDLPFNHLP